MNVETVSEAFIQFLTSQGYGTFGTDLFLNKVPPTSETPEDVFWIATSGGNTVTKLPTGERVKQYFIYVRFRSPSVETVEKTMFKLEETLNSPVCIDLPPFTVYEQDAQSFASNEDNDSEERQVGSLQANIKIYKKGVS